MVIPPLKSYHLIIITHPPGLPKNAPWRDTWTELDPTGRACHEPLLVSQTHLLRMSSLVRFGLGAPKQHVTIQASQI